jgi:HAE1 family hydrophobic/amphiphilic exporter-1
MSAPGVGPNSSCNITSSHLSRSFGSAAPGYSSAQATAALEDVFKQTMPSQMGFDYMGMSYQEIKAAQGVSSAVICGLSFLIVFLIMAAQYESWTLPLSVLMGTPIAALGAFAAIYVRRA